MDSRARDSRRKKPGMGKSGNLCRETLAHTLFSRERASSLDLNRFLWTSIIACHCCSADLIIDVTSRPFSRGFPGDSQGTQASLGASNHVGSWSGLVLCRLAISKTMFSTLFGRLMIIRWLPPKRHPSRVLKSQGRTHQKMFITLHTFEFRKR